MIGYCKDPVCGMQVNEAQAGFDQMTCQYQGQTYYFCSSKCKSDFEAQPEQFIKLKSKAATKGAVK